MSAEFRLESHPIVLMRPSVAAPFGWVGHIPFAYLAVDLLRPSCVVELGTHSGNSYMALCQAVQELNLPTRCFAIDTWEGDSHAQHYGEEVYQSLRARHDPRYDSFSTMLRCRFDDALHQFEDGSVDLLHIDGLHTYDAVKHDFETWLPKLSKKAVVLLHDTAMEQRGFGVHTFFEELLARYPGFGFTHSHGLGVVAVGTDVASSFIAFLHQAQENTADMRDFFQVLAGNLVDAHGLVAQGNLLASQAVVCHLYYRNHGESFSDSRMISLQVDAAEGMLDVRFRLPAGIRPDYLRLDPADFPGVYGVRQVSWQMVDSGPANRVEHLRERLGHIQGELLPSTDAQGVRLVSFDDDPYIEIELASALGGITADASLELIIRVDYEMVITETSVRRLLEQQALTDMRKLSQVRIDMQSMQHDMQSMRNDVQSAGRDVSAHLEKMDRSIEKLASRTLWSWLKGGR